MKSHLNILRRSTMQVVGFGFESNILVCLVCPCLLEFAVFRQIEKQYRARGRIPHSQAGHRGLPGPCFLLTAFRSKPFSLSVVYFLIRKTIYILPKLQQLL